MTRVEQYEAIRRDHFIEGKGIRRIARERGVHRRKVREALASSVPPPRKVPDRDPLVLTLQLRHVVDCWLLCDQENPRKQRHTAHRIWKRLCREHGFIGGESTVRAYVGRRRQELGLSGEMFVPQIHLPGEEGEVDFYEAVVDFPAGRIKVSVLEVRACASGRELHVAFPRATQQAFLEGLALAFEHFGGVFARLRFDNLTPAVRKILRGRQRLETERFVAFRSHYLFEAVFCRPGREGAHEKGGVEGGVGRFRRNHFVPVPTVADFAELNDLLLAGCVADDDRRIAGRPTTIAEDWELERPHLLPLPREPFDTTEVSTHRVDEKSRVVVRRNRYSVPVTVGRGRRVEVRLGAREVVIVHDGREVAHHERCWGVGEDVLDLDHYLELLRRKPGALRGATALHQARGSQQWPANYDALFERLRARYGDSEGARQMVEVLFLHREVDPVSMRSAVETALASGAVDAESIRLLSRSPEPLMVTSTLSELGDLAQYGSAASTDMSMYDALVTGGDEDGDDDPGGPVPAVEATGGGGQCRATGEGSGAAQDAASGLSGGDPRAGAPGARGAPGHAPDA